MALRGLTGRRFGRLVVVGRATNDCRRNTRWVCECDCGGAVVVLALNLRSGHTRSCGCLSRELAASRKPNLRHGHSSRGVLSRTYISWQSMVQRTQCPGATGYKNYGGRGIAVCDRWKDSFENFLADMGERPEGTSIDRIDVDGNYEPGNCRWATPKQQQSNRRKPVKIEV